MNYEDHKDLIRGMGCICTLKRPAVPHHIDSQRHHHDLLTIPLHYELHQGKEGIHTISKKVWQRMWGNEYDLLAKTWRKLPDGYVRELVGALKQDRRIVKRLQMHGSHRLRDLLGG